MSGSQEFETVELFNNELKIGVLVSEWHQKINKRLEFGVLDGLSRCGVLRSNVNSFSIPGAFELPLAAQNILENGYDGVIALGCVVQGETPHFDYVCNACAMGLQEVSLKTNKPAIFGVLTVLDINQAIDRSGGRLGNKGFDCAIALIKMLNLQHSLR